MATADLNSIGGIHVHKYHHKEEYHCQQTNLWTHTWHRKSVTWKITYNYKELFKQGNMFHDEFYIEIFLHKIVNILLHPHYQLVHQNRIMTREISLQTTLIQAAETDLWFLTYGDLYQTLRVQALAQALTSLGCNIITHNQ